MLLKKIIKNLTKEEEKIKIKGLSINSKKVKKGFIFFAIKGKKFNGEKFISEAVKKGAAVIVCSKKFYFRNNKKKIKLVKTSNVRYLLSKIASNFYNLKPKNIIAVTGTNGKTSVADLFYQILDRNNIPVASIGTLGVKIRKKIIRTELTSPDTIDLHRILYKIKKKGIENVIIEASSHGLDQKRIEHLRLKAGVFTNFTQDHLDYHKNMKSYLNAKLHLFKDILRKNNVVISDNTINEFKILKRISKKRGLRLVDIRIIENKILKSFGIKPYEFQSASFLNALIFIPL